MLYNTEAVVIRSIAYGETHAIVTLLTPSGKVAAMAKGAKKPQSRLTAGVQLCVHGMYSIYQKTGMGTLSQAEVLNSYRSLREQLEMAAYAAYFCELVAAVSDDRPNGDARVYRLFLGALNRLTQAGENPALTARVWEAKVLRLLGASPDWRECVRCQVTLADGIVYSPAEGGFLCPSCARNLHGLGKPVIPVPAGIARILEMMTGVPWERLGQVNLNPRTQASLKQVLQFQMTEFAGLSLKSLEFLNSLDEWSTT